MLTFSSPYPTRAVSMVVTVALITLLLPGATRAEGSEVNILLRGQSNANMLFYYKGIWKIESELESRVPGVDITIIADPYTDENGATIHNGTAFLEWAKNGQQESLLKHLRYLPATVRDNPTITLWLHNEYDQANADLTESAWIEAVKSDAEKVRAVLNGQNARTTPYHFVWVPYGFNDRSGAAIRDGMRELTQERDFNARVSSAAERDMKMDAGPVAGAHFGEADVALVSSRLVDELEPVVRELARDTAGRGEEVGRRESESGRPSPTTPVIVTPPDVEAPLPENDSDGEETSQNNNNTGTTGSANENEAEESNEEAVADGTTDTTTEPADASDPQAPESEDDEESAPNEGGSGPNSNDSNEGPSVPVTPVMPEQPSVEVPLPKPDDGSDEVPNNPEVGDDGSENATTTDTVDDNLAPSDSDVPSIPTDIDEESAEEGGADVGTSTPPLEPDTPSDTPVTDDPEDPIENGEEEVPAETGDDESEPEPVPEDETPDDPVSNDGDTDEEVDDTDTEPDPTGTSTDPVVNPDPVEDNENVATTTPPRDSDARAESERRRSSSSATRTNRRSSSSLRDSVRIIRNVDSVTRNSNIDTAAVSSSVRSTARASATTTESATSSVRTRTSATVNTSTSIRRDNDRLSQPVAAWDFGLIASSSLSTEIRDLAGRNPGELLNGARAESTSLRLDGALHQGMRIDGQFGMPGSVTLSAWVNLTQNGRHGAEIISLGENIGLRTDSDRTVFYWRIGDNAWRELDVDETIAGTGWRHLVGQYDSDEERVRLYLDGKLVAEAKAKDPILYSNEGDTYIGRAGLPYDTDYNFTGEIANVRIYNQAISEAEVETLSERR